jgi:hypothetical protein
MVAMFLEVVAITVALIGIALLSVPAALILTGMVVVFLIEVRAR